jgi:3-(3-hydroxy-phenyl)propionate hydroxylase
MATEEGAWSVLRRWIGPEDATLWRQASYRFHALVAREWRRRPRVHRRRRRPPAAALPGPGHVPGRARRRQPGWKLRAVLAGEVSGAAADALLDTYTEERREHVRRSPPASRRSAPSSASATRPPRRRATPPDRGRRRQIKTVPRQDIIPPLAGGLLAAGMRSGAGTLFPQPRVPARPARRCWTSWPAPAGASSRTCAPEQLPPALAALAGAPRQPGVHPGRSALTRSARRIEACGAGRRAGALVRAPRLLAPRWCVRTTTCTAWPPTAPALYALIGRPGGHYPE